MCTSPYSGGHEGHLKAREHFFFILGLYCSCSSDGNLDRTVPLQRSSGISTKLCRWSIISKVCQIKVHEIKGSLWMFQKLWSVLIFHSSFYRAYLIWGYFGKRLSLKINIFCMGLCDTSFVSLNSLRVLKKRLPKSWFSLCK